MMVPLAFLVVLAASLLPLALIAMQRARLASKAGQGPPRGVVLAALVPVVILALFTLGGPDREIAMLAALALLALAVGLWIREFTGLMAMPDDAFPGRHDKLIWAAVMVVLPPIGPIAFAIFRRAYWPAQKPAMDASAREWA